MSTTIKLINNNITSYSYDFVCVCVLGWVEEEACVTDYLTGTDQKIPDWLIKVPFLGKVNAAIRVGY